MHSLKSTGIAVLLLAVSIGLYQVSSTKDTTTNYGNDLSVEIDQGGVFGTAPMGAQPQFSAPQFQQAQPQFNQQPPAQFAQNQYRSTPPVGGSGSTQFASHQRAPNQPIARYPQQNPPQQLPQVSNRLPQLAQPNSTQAPSFDDLRRKFEQSAPVQQIASGSNQLVNDLSATGNQIKNEFSAMETQVQNQFSNNFQAASDSVNQNLAGQLEQAKQAFPDLSQAKSAMVEAIDQSRDDGLIEALKSEVSEAVDSIPTLSSPSAFDGISLEAPRAAPPATVKNEFMPANEVQADSEFNAAPIAAANDSVNSLASAIDSSGSDFSVSHADAMPDVPTLNKESASMNLESAWAQVDRLVAEKKFRPALGLLTRFYRQPDMTNQQRARLHEWLDALAGKVIYSAEHHFQDEPYTIRSGETLNQIAGRWNVPAQVIYNINRGTIGDSSTIVAGTELKVISGPFRAEVDLSDGMLTLYLKNLYAGRFPVRVGVSGDAQPGQYRVVAKAAQGHTWRDADGNDFPPESSENGYGPWWIGLTGSLCIHAIDENTPVGHAGCIGLREKDAKDIFGILIDGSELKILR